MSPGLLQDSMDGYINFFRLPQSLVELQVLSRGILTQQVPSWWFKLWCPNQGNPSLNPMGSKFLIHTL